MIETAGWTDLIFAITLFTEELEETKAFYSQVFEPPTLFEDADSAVFKFGDTMVNLLRVSGADELINPASAARQADGNRAVHTLSVADVDAKCTELVEKGVTLLNGPMDRPWGVRTASFKDPAGNIWEIAK